MKEKLLAILLFFGVTTYAQVGIGTTTPHSSSLLEINATNKGVLIPRVNLISTLQTSLDGVENSKKSLLIYNSNINVTGEGAVGEGYYYFDGTLWIPFQTYNNTYKAYGEIYRNSNLIGMNTNTAIAFGNQGVTKNILAGQNYIEVVKPGIYKITYTINIEKISSSGSIETAFYLHNGTNEVTNSRVYADVSRDPDFVTSTKTVLVNVTTSNTRFSVFPSITSSDVRIMNGTSINVELID